MPDDPDVRAASRVRGQAGEGAPKKKRHHYIASTYMDGFCSPDGKLWAYHLDNPHDPQPSLPTSVGFRNYYYSQKRPDGSRDDDSFEDLWGAFETVWPETLRALTGGRLSPATSFNALGMMGISLVRVPASRERHELLLATDLRAKVRAMERAGILPEEFQQYAGKLDDIPVGINLQQSIRTMMDDLKAFGDLCFKIGFEVVHNRTDLPFITSDNPVCIYDPFDPPGRRRPYDYDKDVEVIFPLDSNRLLRGSHRLRPVNNITRHVELADRGAVARLNNTISQFAYGLALAKDRSSDGVIALHAARCPTLSIQVRERPKNVDIVWKHVFGKRPRMAPYVDTEEKAARIEAAMAAGTAVLGPTFVKTGSSSRVHW